MKVDSGEDGADFGFNLDPTGWGVDGVYGYAFRDQKAALDGPGELTSTMIGPGGPAGLPGYCGRGPGPVPAFTYELKLPPDTSTVVEIPISLNASPLEGMDSTLRLRYYANVPGALSPRMEAPVQIGGRMGVAIRFGVGESIAGSAETMNGNPIRLKGFTSPALPNTEIRIKAVPFAAPINAAPPIRWIRVMTDAGGAFLSKELRFRRSAFWRLSAYPRVGPSFDGHPSCGPTLLTRVDTRPADLSDLTGNSFRSVSVKGTKLVGQKKVTLSFESILVDHDDDPTTVPHRVHTLIGNAGCNTLTGQYWLKNGRLVWSRQLAGTKMACRKPVDEWLKRTLRKGVGARIVEGQLVLTNKRGLKIVLGRRP